MKSYNEYLEEQQTALLCSHAADVIVENNVSVESVLNALVETLILEESDPQKLKILQHIYSELSAGGIGGWLGNMAGRAVQGIGNMAGRAAQGFQQGFQQQGQPGQQQGQQPGSQDQISNVLNQAMQALQQGGFQNAIPTMQQIIQQVQNQSQQQQQQPAQGQQQQPSPFQAGLNNLASQQRKANTPGGYDPQDLQKTFGVKQQQQQQPAKTP